MTKMFVNRSMFFTLFLILLLGCYGCSGEPDKPFGEPVQACNLFSDEEIETLLGAKVDDQPRSTHKVDEQTGFWMSMCNYYAPDINLSAGIMIRPLGKGKSIDKAFDENVAELKAGLPDYKVEPVSGIGTKAFWNGPTGQLTVFEGAYTLLLSGGQPGQTEEEKLAFCRKLAEAVLNKL